MTDEAAEAFLRCYGFRYVVIPEPSPTIRYLGQGVLRAREGSFRIVELPNRAMLPFERLQRTAPGKFEFSCAD